MINIDEYKANPCRMSSIPYWKIGIYKMPSNLLVVHDEDYNIEEDNIWEDTLYFRLKHDLKSIEAATLDKTFAYRKVDINCISDLEKVEDIINTSYTDIKVNLEQVIKWTQSEVFAESLWIFIIDINNEKPAALGIAELDSDVHEGMLEWIQVLPEYRKLKLGQALVNMLLTNLIGKVDFVTVSGKVDNKTNPERLYRKCGFYGDDLWHVLIRKL